MSAPLPALLAHFALLSLIAFGGATAVLPEMHRFAVDIRGWVTDAEFAELFALAQAAPGPNMMIVSLIGLRAAGIPGAVVATLAMCGPSCVLTFSVMRVLHRFRWSAWPAIVQTGLTPITVGLVMGSGYVLTRAADHTPLAYGLTGATVAWTLATRVNPLWLLAGAAALGLFGLV